VTGTGLFGAFAMVLSATIVNVAVPEVRGAFGVGQDEAQWMATAFLATMTASQLLNAWMIAAFGKRGAFLWTLVVFTIGAAICATATSMDQLIVGRVMQGAAAGVVQPLVMVTIVEAFPADRRGTAMGIFGSGVVLAPAIGPAIGGIAIDEFSWRLMFLMPLPAVLIAFVGGLIFMPVKTDRKARPPFDWTGFGLLLIALALTMNAIAGGPRFGWSSDKISGQLLLALLLAILFLYWQTRSRAPILALDLFKNPGFSAAVAVAFVFGAGNFASSYIIPVFVQDVQGYTATRAGMLLMPAGLLLVAALPLTGRLADKLPGHWMIAGGLGFFALGTLAMSVGDPDTAFWTFAGFTALSRFGLAFILPSLSAAAFKALGPDELTRGSGNMNFIRQLGGASGTNLMVVWLQTRHAVHAQNYNHSQSPENPATRELFERLDSELASAGIGEAGANAVANDYLAQVIDAQALASAFQDCFIALGVVFFIAIVPAFLLGRVTNK
jgi:DHA2 family multidrug resistance protein